MKKKGDTWFFCASVAYSRMASEVLSGMTGLTISASLVGKPRAQGQESGEPGRSIHRLLVCSWTLLILLPSLGLNFQIYKMRTRHPLGSFHP